MAGALWRLTFQFHRDFVLEKMQFLYAHLNVQAQERDKTSIHYATL